MKCKYCNSRDVVHRDYTKRLVKEAQGKKYWIRVERIRCKNCRKIFRLLPDFVYPYKHYNKQIIDGVMNNEISENDILYEDYPASITMTRWRKGAKNGSKKF